MYNHKKANYIGGSSGEYDARCRTVMRTPRIGHDVVNDPKGCKLDVTSEYILVRHSQQENNSNCGKVHMDSEAPVYLRFPNAAANSFHIQDLGILKVTYSSQCHTGASSNATGI